MRVIETQKGGVFYGLDDSFDLYRKCVRDLIRSQTSMGNHKNVLAFCLLAAGSKYLACKDILQ